MYHRTKPFLHWIVEHNILSSQLQQHRIIKEFVDTNIFTQALQKSKKYRIKFTYTIYLSIFIARWFSFTKLGDRKITFWIKFTYTIYLSIFIARWF